MNETLTPLTMERFKLGASLDKSTASHHSMNNFSYYVLPVRKEAELADMIIRHFMKETPLFLCEHIPADKPHRFFIGVFVCE